MEDKEFIEKSIELYREFNKQELFYGNGTSYDKLVSADPFYISPAQYRQIENNGKAVWDWYSEQKRIYADLDKSKDLSWLKKMLNDDLGSEVLDMQIKVAAQDGYSSIVRSDLSSFPYHAHEIQARWGGIAYINGVPSTFDKILPPSNGEKTLHKDIIQELVDIINDSDIEQPHKAVFLSSKGFLGETARVLSRLPIFEVSSVDNFNSENFKITKNGLFSRKSGERVTFLYRRGLHLKEMLKTDFGRGLVDLYLDKKLAVEPDLDMSNDMKVGIALAFDSRTREYFSDASRSLFLKTALVDTSLVSFRNTFPKIGDKYKSLDDYLTRAVKADRRFVFKHAGSDLAKSYGGVSVYRLDKNNAAKLVDTVWSNRKESWIMQELDKARYSHRYLVGDYNNAKSTTIADSSKFSGRFKILYRHNKKGNTSVVDITANLVNDHWKARSKTSNQLKGTGTLTIPVRVKRLVKSDKAS